MTQAQLESAFLQPEAEVTEAVMNLLYSQASATGVAAATASVGGEDACEASPIEIKDSSEEEGLELDDKEEPEECC